MELRKPPLQSIRMQNSGKRTPTTRAPYQKLPIVQSLTSKEVSSSDQMAKLLLSASVRTANSSLQLPTETLRSLNDLMT